MQSNMYTKATVGLGLGLPSEVLITKTNRPMVGLGIVMDYGILDGFEEDVAVVSSPPLLAIRRSPPKPPAESPGSEFRPMRTPSPSLRGASDFVSPKVEHHASRAATIGLGIVLPCLTDTELITSIATQSTARVALPGLDLSFLEDDHSDGFSPEETSSLSALASAWNAREQIVCTFPNTAHPKPKPANFGLGFDLNGADESPESAVHNSDSTLQKPTLGFGSPFWVTYAATMLETPEIIL
jgi:hypothetical protein